MYLTYDEYLEFGGALDETTFNNLEFQAEALIDWYTFSRLKNDTTYSDEVKRCMYVLIDLVHSKEQATSVGQDVVSGQTKAAISSQSNDGVSISYNVMDAKNSYDTINQEIGKCINMYLQSAKNKLGHRLLYRGIYPGE